MGGVYKCERFGAKGHHAAICRAPNAIGGACGTCDAYDHISRPCRAARMHANVIIVTPAMYGPPPAFAGADGVDVLRPGDGLPQQGGEVMHDDGGDVWAGDGAGGSEQHSAGGLSLIHI